MEGRMAAVSNGDHRGGGDAAGLRDRVGEHALERIVEEIGPAKTCGLASVLGQPRLRFSQLLHVQQRFSQLIELLAGQSSDAAQGAGRDRSKAAMEQPRYELDPPL